MDYHRIYSEFIADRKLREAGLTGYMERHHVLPRALGGGDEASNIVRLTAEDHLFAHLLLARAHGGRMWRPLLLMLRPARQLGVVSRGKRARRIAAQARVACAADQIGRRRPDVSRALKGRAKSDTARANMSRAAKGKVISAATRERMAIASTGRTWSEASRAKLAARRMGEANPAKCAEARAKISAASKARMGAAGNPRYDHTVREFRHLDGRVERLTKFEMCERHGLNRTCLNYVISGARQATKGWSIAS